MARARAVVAGGGIGGLTAALALHRRGWGVSVLERAASVEPVGAGISLWPNALRALDALGIAGGVRDAAVLGGRSGIRLPDGRWLARSDIGKAIRARYGEPLVVLHRAELVQLLMQQLPPGAVRTGVEVSGVEPGDAEGPATVRSSAGTYDGELVVAADGIRSRLRAQLFPDHPGPRYAGYTAWRMIVPDPGGSVGSETWGRDGERFAVVPMAGGLCYCYATANAPAGRRHDDVAVELRHRFGTWHEPIPTILRGLDAGDVLHNDIEELVEPLPAFHSGRVALLGDSAHAMTPDLGQGGCQAIEDAVVLAAVLGDGSDGSVAVTARLPRYSEARLPRTTGIAQRSRKAGRLYQAPAVVQRLAARTMGVVPAFIVARGLASVVDWRPPESLSAG